MSLIPPQRIEYTDGTWEYVHEPIFIQRQYLEAEIDEFYGAIAGIPIYPPEEILKDNITVHDFLIFKTRSHIERIAKFFRVYQSLVFDIDAMLLCDRHNFFYCTEPVTIIGNDNPIQGLSKLQVLMGLTYPIQSKKKSADKKGGDRPMTTGNMRARIMAATLLNFKGNPEIMAHVGMGTLLDILEEAGNLMRDPKDDKKDQVFVATSGAIAVDKNFDNQLWLDNRDRVVAALEAMSIYVPEGF